MKLLLLPLLGASLSVASASHAGDTCEVKSGAATAALVELYTSEGCSSCPPADRQLSDLRRQLDANAVLVPLALHVTYWDRIGWKDIYAQPTFDSRQSWLLQQRRKRVVYTPQFFLNGDLLREWSWDLPSANRRFKALPAPFTIALNTTPAAAGLSGHATVSAPDVRTGGDLYLAITESGLVSRVLRGENSGVTLRHDNTTRLWLGPFPLRQGKASVHQEVSLPAGWARERVQAVALVQNSDDGRILQAVSTQQCQAAQALAPGSAR
jgi:hypothetical protein